MIKIVCGINWGDEGKGRITDYIARDADFVVRYQGGNNAGHTVVTDQGTFKLHLIPSGILRNTVTNVLGPGMVVDIKAFADELNGLKEKGIDVSNIIVSDRASMVLPFHPLEDGLEEQRLKKDAYGSTKRGIAPSYGDRYMKKSILLGELHDLKKLRDRLKVIIEWKAALLKNLYGYVGELTDLDYVMNWIETHRATILPYITDTADAIYKGLDKGKNVVFEAQLGALRDIYFGIYPFTTSSCVLAGHAKLGSGVFFKEKPEVIGVMKAFSTCVGAGPFVTEMKEDVAGTLREFAMEYGASTGRPRRIGHFDAFASRYGASLQAADYIALTKLDSLSGLDTLKICTGYTHNGKPVESFPINAVLDECVPEYIEMPGWTEDITGCRKFEDLPVNAQNYVNKIGELMEIPFNFISVGPERESLIVV